MSHIPPTPNSDEARLQARFARLEREVEVLKQQPTFYQAGASNSPIGVQFGVIRAIAGSEGFFSLPITLPIAWKAEHLAFLVSLHPLAVQGTWLTNSGPYDETGSTSLTKGLVAFHNPATAQEVDVWWTSFGR